MIASLHIADVGLMKSLRVRPPKAGTVPGLLDARSALMARFTASLKPDPVLGRAMLLWFWDDEVSLDRYLEAGDSVAAAFEDGLQLRLEPMKAHGEWPGFPTDLDSNLDDGLNGSAEGYAGPVVVLTLGLLRLRRSLAWTRASNRVQKQFLETPGVIWAMGATKPPLFAATVSLWESASAATGFAHESGGAHAEAIRENTKGPFMRQEIFARFKPLSSKGSLGSDPELVTDWLSLRLS